MPSDLVPKITSSHAPSQNFCSATSSAISSVTDSILHLRTLCDLPCLVASQVASATITPPLVWKSLPLITCDHARALRLTVQPSPLGLFSSSCTSFIHTPAFVFSLSYVPHHMLPKLFICMSTAAAFLVHGSKLNHCLQPPQSGASSC